MLVMHQRVTKELSEKVPRSGAAVSGTQVGAHVVAMLYATHSVREAASSVRKAHFQTGELNTKART